MIVVGRRMMTVTVVRIRNGRVADGFLDLPLIMAEGVFFWAISHVLRVAQRELYPKN